MTSSFDPSAPEREETRRWAPACFGVAGGDDAPREAGAAASSRMPRPWELADLAGAAAAARAGGAGAGAASAAGAVAGRRPTESPAEARRIAEIDASYAKGHVEGLREGTARAERAIAPALEAAAAAADAFGALRADLARDLSRQVRVLSLAVASKLIEREVSGDPTILRDLVGRAIEMLHVDEPVEGRLHPADLEILTPEIEALASRGRARTIHWLADPTMERGGFVLEGANQILDGRLDLAIRSIHERLEFD